MNEITYEQLSFSIRRLAEIVSFYAEVEGMKAENRVRRHTGDAPAYGEAPFMKISSELGELSRAWPYW